MFKALHRRIKDWEQRVLHSYSHDITDPVERKKSLHYNDWHDHGILRYRWHNFAEVAPGVFRSNHPNHKRFEAYAKMGIKTILTLRGGRGRAPFRFEEESCRLLGMDLIVMELSARRATPRDALLELIHHLETIPKPFLFHCKSGADRTGLAAAVYLLHVAGAPLSVAKKQLSMRFVHLKVTKTGVLDYMIYLYGKRLEQGAISFKDWVAAEYDAERTQKEFNATGFFERMKL